LESLDGAPDTTLVPVLVAAVHEGASYKTIKRQYQVFKRGRRNVVLLGELRRKRQEIITA
jgi:hypothetical protein